MPRQRYDWEAIEREYRTGRLSLQELSRRYGPHPSTISSRAKKRNWAQDLTEKVRQRTREKISRRMDDAHLDGLDPSSDEAIVELAAQENAGVVQGHRVRLQRWRELEERYATLLGNQMAADKVTTLDRNGNLVEIDQPLEYFGKAMGHGTQALDRLLKHERLAYGLDDDEDDEEQTFEQMMQSVAPADDDQD